LLFVVGHRADALADDEAALDFHRSLRVVGLREVVARAGFHDPAFGIGEVELILRVRGCGARRFCSGPRGVRPTCRWASPETVAPSGIDVPREMREKCWRHHWKGSRLPEHRREQKKVLFNAFESAKIQSRSAAAHHPWSQ
jgi:hypothetical protein